MTEIIKDIHQAVMALDQGQLVAIPTETVYGLAADATSSTAIAKVFELKNRPLDHPLIMHVHEGADLSRWAAFIPEYAKVLMAHFWPGPLTFVFKATPEVNRLLTGGQDTVALSCPAHPMAQSLLKAFDKPVVAPSANAFGKVSPTTAEHVVQSFPSSPLLVLDGGRCSLGIESTLIDATEALGYRILRHGTIDQTMLRKISSDELPNQDVTLRAPGLLESHYQPEKKVMSFESMADMRQKIQSMSKKCYILCYDPFEHGFQHDVVQLPLNPQTWAYELYYQLRQADKSSADAIMIQLPPDIPAFSGVRERIIKASV